MQSGRHSGADVSTHRKRPVSIAKGDRLERTEGGEGSRP